MNNQTTNKQVDYSKIQDSHSNNISNNNNIIKEGKIKQGIRGTTNVNTIPQKPNNQRRVLPKKAQSNPKYTENWINIKAIKNGIIYNNNNEMVSGVKVSPKNIFILDQSQMDNTLAGLMNYYNTIDYEFWLIVADRPVDIAMYQAELQLLFNRTPDQRIRKIISQDMNKGEFFKNNSVVDTEYYLLFKEKKLDAVQKKLRDMINGLASAGLVASQTSNDDLRMIVNNFLNGGRSFESGTVIIK